VISTARSLAAAEILVLQALVRLVLVVLADEIGQDLAEMVLVEDQDVIQALAAEGATNLWTNEFARGARTGVLITRTPPR
jgi:hypothetical protein